MNGARNEGERRYEEVLRNLGAYLDEQAARQVSILEIPDGFVLRYRRSETVVASFSRDDLPDYRPARGSGRPGGDRARYQDFFRSLGHELDDEQAHTVLVDEIEDSYLLSYQHLDPKQGFRPTKRVLLLGGREQEIILEYAHARRSETRALQRTGLFAWLFGVSGAVER